MRVIMVIIFLPFLSNRSCLFYIFKQISIKYIFSEGLVKTLTESVLHRLALLYADMPYGGVGAKALKSFCDKLRAVVRTNISRFSIPINKVFNKFYYFFRRKTII